MLNEKEHTIKRMPMQSSLSKENITMIMLKKSNSNKANTTKNILKKSGLSKKLKEMLKRAINKSLTGF